MVVATPSVSTVANVVGTHRTVSITFTSSDRQPITGFGISGNMTMLPAGWSGPASFGCATVSTGSGCVLNLTYAPTAATNGTLTLDYVFVANSGVPNTTGSLSLPYVATPADNVMAAASPTGQITAVAGSGTQSVAVTFTTDDGTVATGLDLTTNLSTLPAGWSAASPSFSCPTVSTGNGCQLVLTFSPATLAASGTLVLNYAYTNDAGAAKTGSLNLAYTGDDRRQCGRDSFPIATDQCGRGRNRRAGDRHVHDQRRSNRDRPHAHHEFERTAGGMERRVVELVLRHRQHGQRLSIAADVHAPPPQRPAALWLCIMPTPTMPGPPRPARSICPTPP